MSTDLHVGIWLWIPKPLGEKWWIPRELELQDFVKLPLSLLSSPFLFRHGFLEVLAFISVFAPILSSCEISYICVFTLGLKVFLNFFLLFIFTSFFCVCVLAEWGVGGWKMSICRGQRSTLVSSQPFFSFFVCDRIPHWTCIHISASMAGEWGPIFSRVSLSSITSAYRCAQMLHGVAGHMNPGTPASSPTVLWTEPSL